MLKRSVNPDSRLPKQTYRHVSGKQRKTIDYKRKYVVIFLAILLIAGNLFAVSHSESFDVNDLEFSIEERGYDKVKLADLLVTTTRGEPELPVKFVNLIIPSGTEVDDIDITVNQQTLEGTYFINPSPGPMIPSDIPEPAEPDSAIYNSPNIFPENCVEVLSHGYFDGANRIVSLSIYPVQYIPADSILKFNESIYFTLSFKSSYQPVAVPNFRLEKNVEIYENALRSIVENDEDVDIYKHQPNILTEPRENDVEIYIIGESIYEPDFNDFIKWKRKKGIIVEYKSTESIWDEYLSGDDWHSHPITDMAGRIRAYLYDMYSDNCMIYTIIVGGESDYDVEPDPNDEMLPVRYCCRTHDKWIQSGYPSGHPFHENNFYRIPADIYFADFDGDYDLEGDENGYYGESSGSYQGQYYPADPIDKYPEIFVGRVIVSPQEEVDNHEQIRRWTDKLITYETNPGYGDFDYLMKSVLFNGYLSSTGSSRIYGNEFTNLLNQYLDEFTIWDTQHNPPWPTGVEIIDKMSEGYGITHSYYHGCKSRITNCAVQSGYSLYALDEYFHCVWFDGDGLDNLVEGDGKFSVHYSVSCSPGAYDRTGCEYSGGEWGEKICFAEAFATYTKARGGPAIIANTNIGHAGSKDIEKHFLINIFENQCYNIGVALANAKTTTNCHTLILATTLFGDPEMPVWTEIPSYLEVSHNYEEYSVTVSSDGVPVDYALVFFENSETGETEFDTTGISGIPGYAQCSFDFNEITITKHNYIPYITHIALNGEIWSGETDLKWLTVVPSGRTLNISGTVNLLELGGKNSKIVVEESGTLNINANTVISGNKSTFYPDEFSPIQVVIPGNCIEVYGDILIGENVSFTSPEGKSWDGVFLYNTDAEVTMNNVIFEKCKLYNESLFLNVTSSDFTNSGIKQSGDVLELYYTNFDNSIVSCFWESGKSPPPAYIEVDINNCYFESCSDYAVSITNYPLYELQNNVITNGEGGFDISNSGNPKKCIISDNHIYDNSGYGICIYNSYAEICDHSTDWGQNVIENNSRGIVGLHQSSITIIGNQDYPHSTIQDNEAQELYFDPSSFPEKICYNKIIDDNYINGSVDQYLIHCKNYTGGERKLIVEDNYWGPECEGWIEWTGDHRFLPGEAFDYIPAWIPGPPVNPPKGIGAKGLYADADSLIQIEEYESAKQVYRDIIGQYPESKYSIFSMRNLLPLETVSGQDFASIKEYYLTDPNCNYNPERTKLSEYLANYCNINMKNYPDAISFFEDIIEDPDTELDSIYAVIDAGYTYLLMENSGGKSYIGRIPGLKLKSVAEFEETRDKLLTKLLGLPEQYEEEIVTETTFYLGQNYPNPMRSLTNISFSIPKDAKNSEIKIYNIKGQLVKQYSIINSQLNWEQSSIEWDGKDKTGKQVSSGIYLYKLSVGNNKSIIKKMVLLR